MVRQTRRRLAYYPTLSHALIFFIYGCATLQFVRYYVKSTTFYLKMPEYLAGHERLPFQERVLPILFLKPMYHSEWVMSHLAHANGVFTPDKGPFYLLALVGLVVAGAYTQKLYALLTEDAALSFLVYPVFLLSVMFTYAVRSEADYSYPYDFIGLAFFTAGLYYIYSRRFAGLVMVVLIGTFNRETTLFLIGIYALDAAFQSDVPLHFRFRLSAIPWMRLALLSVIWIAIKGSLAHAFRGNDTSEDFLRVADNLHELKPRLVPALIDICGFVMPCVLVFSRLLHPRRFANYLLILIPWFGVMFCSGVLLETRIYGELCSYSAVAAVLIMERAARQSILAGVPC